MKGNQFTKTFAPGVLRGRTCAFWLCVVGLTIPVRAIFAAAPPEDQGAVGIVHSAPVAPVAPPTLVKPFLEWREIADLPSPPSTRCSLDVISGRPAPLALVVDGRVPLTLVGWAGDDKRGVPLEIVFVLMGGDKNWGVVGKAGLPRPDVADAWHNPALEASGYSITGDPAAIPQGEYHAALIERFGNADSVCSLGRTIAVK